MNKGVVFTLDLIFSLTIFTIIILTILWAWGETHSRVSQFQERESRRIKAVDLSDILITTMGNPEYWEDRDVVNYTNTYSIGLAGDENVLDIDKIVKLNNTNYTFSRMIMGLSREDYNLTIVSNWSGVEVFHYSMGRSPENATERNIVRRYALLNGTRVEVRLELSYDTAYIK